MNFKKVNGLGRAEYAVKAMNAAMDNLHNPDYVDAWLTWFDKQPSDSPCGHCGICEECAPQINGGSGCRNCAEGHALVCADDCPQPEFYAGDLEEIAHAVITRIADAFTEFNRVTAMLPRPVDVQSIIDGIRAEIALPGYVEGLLPL